LHRLRVKLASKKDSNTWVAADLYMDFVAEQLWKQGRIIMRGLLNFVLIACLADTV
jgi:hypothetical protein